VTDLLPAIARLYFTGRFGSDFKVSSLQAALLCGIGLQHKSVESLNAELGLPSNQILAMFNKAVRKMSMALNGILEESEKSKMLGGKERAKAEKAADKMKDVSHQTLQEDVQEAADVAMKKLKQSKSSKAANLPAEIMEDAEIMQYAIKGSDKEWSEALKESEVNENGTIAIRSVQEKAGKRKLGEEDIEREGEMATPSKTPKSKKSKSSKKKKSSKKTRSQ